MALKQITKFVVSYCEIPESIEKPNWLMEHMCGAFVECHIDDEDNDELTVWLLSNYPELEHEDSFFIELDY